MNQLSIHTPVTFLPYNSATFPDFLAHASLGCIAKAQENSYMATATPTLEAKLNKSPGKIGMVGFAVVLLVGIVYAAFQLLSDLSTVHSTRLLLTFCYASRYWSRWGSNS
jgi:hypothetical protein